MADALQPYVVEWERFNQRRQPGASVGEARMRQDAFQRFVSVGFPTTRDEEWRFTSVAPIAGRAFEVASSPAPQATSADISMHRLAGPSAAEIVFVNGHYAPALSRTSTLPAGTCIVDLASALATRYDQIVPHIGRIASLERHPFVALNTAFLDDGAYVELPAGAILEHLIHLLFIATDTEAQWTMIHPRILIVLGANSQASVVETYAGPAGARYFANTVTEITLGENAVLDHYKLQYESAEAYHVGSIHLQAQRSATCRAHSISAGGALVRNDVVAVLNGEGVECALNGLYLADAQRLVDNHTTIDHAQPHCGSREVYKGILADRARGVFNGKIVVRPDAQKTDAKQTNRALLLSEDAQINTKPQLEIFANDVKCTHGAAVGQLDDEALFYLRSRGLSDSEARRLLIHAFAGDVLERLPLEGIRAGVESHLRKQLARVLPSAA